MTTPNKSLEEEAPMPNDFIYEDASATDKTEVPDNADEEDTLQTQEASAERTIVASIDSNTEWDLVVREEEPSDDPRYMMSGALPPSSDASSLRPTVPRTIRPQTNVPTPVVSVQDGNTTTSDLSSSNKINDHTRYRAEADAENRRNDGTSLALLKDPSATIDNVFPHALNLDPRPYRSSRDSINFPAAGPSSKGKGKGKGSVIETTGEPSCQKSSLHCQYGNAAIEKLEENIARLTKLVDALQEHCNVRKCHQMKELDASHSPPEPTVTNEESTLQLPDHRAIYDTEANIQRVWLQISGYLLAAVNALLDRFTGARSGTQPSHHINGNVEPPTDISFGAAVTRPVELPLNEEWSFWERSVRLRQLYEANRDLGYEEENSWDKALRALEAAVDHPWSPEPVVEEQQSPESAPDRTDLPTCSPSQPSENREIDVVEDKADTEQGDTPSAHEDGDKKYASYGEFKAEKRKRQKIQRAEAKVAKKAAEERAREANTQTGSEAEARASQNSQDDGHGEGDSEGNAKDSKWGCIVL
jgi:hypothetical protein